MTHLSEVELVDLLDGALPPARERHLDECDSCRATATRMHAAFALAKDVEMPEPSPLFWEHFSARVHEGVRSAEAEAGQPAGWFGWAQGATAKWAMSAALLTLMIVAGVWRATAPAPRKVAPAATVASVAAGAANEDPDRVGRIRSRNRRGVGTRPHGRRRRDMGRCRGGWIWRARWLSRARDGNADR